MNVKTEVTILAPNGEPYVPLPQQRGFHESPVQHRAFLGDVGTGKTLAGAVEAVKMALLYPGSEGLVARATWKELVVVLWPLMCNLFPAALVRSEKSVPRECRLDLMNGSRIYGLPLGGEGWKWLQSCVFDWAWLDEPDEMDEQVGYWLPYRLRNYVGPHRLWVTGKPMDDGWAEPMFSGRGENYAVCPSGSTTPSGIEVAVG